ncbi:FecR family protein [Pseudobacter ginsenosidimutans]|uniref:FecR family protein n=1 Tax=Pseudobacter ginsenosidimutans TaxID=661488 RepID=A0A4Q7N578_9BACT|nr:FecR family protein [Pseudobacter ginsenosidimutans]QEC44714.1 DUF4974 domain-containing protein [Pseudobacter ginsenosidimutans]RZS76195.1 FecR family protein [Pseudobacter ginsenosidimutans]
MLADQLKILIERFLDESITAAEKAQLASMLEEDAHADAFKNILSDELKQRRFELEPDEETGRLIRNQVLLQIHSSEEENTQAPVRNIRRNRLWYWAAASALVLITSGIVLFSIQEKANPVIETVKSVDIPAGREGAILTLADGSQLVLDSLRNGKIAEQNGSDIHLSNGAMTYEPKEDLDSKVTFNTMTTPKGRQFQFTLPDGTKVWLNAASSLKYPTAFTGKQRAVQLTGEAYFEVAADMRKPFIVTANQKAEVEVLGTEFNINSYDNEIDIKATLVNGMVKVKNISTAVPASVNKEMLLKPGQQAIVIPAPAGNYPAITIDQSADIEKITAWKKGLFNFEGSSLVEVMKELERWYDIEVSYEGSPPAIRFYGKMGKDLSLKDLLDALDMSKVKFVIEGKKLIVKK